MKKLFKSLIVILVLILTLVSCDSKKTDSNLENPQISSDQNSEAPSEAFSEDALAEAEPAVSASKFEERIFRDYPTATANIDVSDELLAMVSTVGDVNHLVASSYADRSDSLDAKVAFFLLPDSHENSQVVNNTIETFMSSLVESALDDSVSVDNPLTLDLKTEVTLYNDQVISMTISGYINSLLSAHPADVFTTLTLNLDTGEPIDLTDYMTVDDAFVVEALKYPAKDLYSVGLVEMCRESILSEDILQENSSQPVSPYFHTAFYLKHNAVCASFLVAHVAGDHMEFEMPLK